MTDDQLRIEQLEEQVSKLSTLVFEMLQAQCYQNNAIQSVVTMYAKNGVKDKSAQHWLDKATDLSGK